MVRTFVERCDVIRPGVIAATALSVLALAGAAQAQTMSNNGSSFNAGYGRSSDQENQAANVSMTDTNGNFVVINGLVQASGTSSMFASASARLSGAADSFSGAGVSSGSASAIGNNLDVVVEGNDNTVIVNSQQTNTGNITATTSTNGKP